MSDSTPTKVDLWFKSFIETGDASAAVDVAGYDYSTPESKKQIAYQNKMRCADKILDATRIKLNNHAPMAIAQLANLSQNAESEAVRRQAAKDIAAMAGLDVQRTEDLTKHDTRSDKELIEALSQMLKSDSLPIELKQAISMATSEDVIPMKKVA